MTRGLGRFLRHNLIALLALFLALGGTSFAAAALINGRQIKPHTIAKNRLTNAAIAGLRGNRGPQGPAGAQGAQGPQGPQGVQGPAGPITGDLPAGVTLRGAYGLEGNAATNTYFGGTESFVLRLSSAPAPTFIPAGTTPPAQCPGSASDPQATAGNLCVYESATNNNRSSVIVFQPSGVGRYGFDYEVFAASGSGNFWSYGTWAVTAPTSSRPQHSPNHSPSHAPSTAGTTASG